MAARDLCNTELKKTLYCAIQSYKTRRELLDVISWLGRADICSFKIAVFTLLIVSDIFIIRRRAYAMTCK